MFATTELSVSAETRGQVAIIRVTGHLLIGETSPFSARLEDQIARGMRRFIIDLQECTYMDSGGIGELVRAHNDIMRAGGQDVLILNPAIRELLEMLKICNRIVPACDTEDEALQFLAEAVI